ncbi:hypothetical protein VPH35_111961 [Triticum aestivum]
MDDLERRLQLAVVMYVGGARPLVSCEDAAEAIAVQLGIPRFRFSVHKFHPEDFLVVFAAHQFRNLALAVPSIEHQGFKLFIKPWLRQAQASSRLMRVQVDVMIEGVPSHAWSQDTTAEILGSACLIESLAPETASREDLSLFKLRAWCVDPDEVPVFRKLWVLELVGTTRDPAARAPAFRQLLEYPVLVHIGRVRDFSPPELWRGRSGSDDGSGQSGLPDNSRGSQLGGDWVVQPWSRGVRDARGAGREQPGPANGGAGGGTSARCDRQSAFVADQVRAEVQVQGTLVPGLEEAGQDRATNQTAPAREIPQVDAAAAEADLVVPTQTDPEAGQGVEPPTFRDPVRPDSPRDPPSLVISVVGQDQSNGWAPVADLLHGSVGGQPMSAVEVAPTSNPGAMQPDVERRGTVGDVTTYAACEELALICSEPGGRNIGQEWDATEARLSYKEELAVNNIKTFCVGLLKKLAPPLLKEFEGLRGVKPGQDPFTPRRTTRSLGVGGPRKTKASAAETVLLKTLGFDCEDLAVSEDALGQLRQVFDSPLQEPQLRAIAAIFGKAIPLNMGGEVECDAMARA